MTRAKRLAPILAAALFATACSPTHTATQIVVDCTVDNADKIDKLVDEFKTLLRGQSPDWGAVTTAAVAAGQAIGGCALAKAVQWYTSTSLAPGARDALDARAVFEAYRLKHARGVTFRTAFGDL